MDNDINETSLVMDLDDMGTNETCMFSDDEEEIDQSTKCLICTKSSGGAGEFMKHIRNLYHQLLGTLQREAIYDILERCYETDYRLAMLSGGEVVPKLSRREIKHHFEKHESSPLADVIYDLRTVQIIQEDLRQKGIRTRHSVTGITTIDTSKVKLYLELSKQKLALHRTLKKIRSDMPKTAKIAPHVFFKQDW